MKTRKTILALCATLALTFGLTACGEASTKSGVKELTPAEKRVCDMTKKSVVSMRYHKEVRGMGKEEMLERLDPRAETMVEFVYDKDGTGKEAYSLCTEKRSGFFFEPGRGS